MKVNNTTVGDKKKRKQDPVFEDLKENIVLYYNRSKKKSSSECYKSTRRIM